VGNVDYNKVEESSQQVIARKHATGKENNGKDIPATKLSAQKEYPVRGGKASIYS
jgi:hypothetical protein